jgi:hypothetical protein
MWNVRTLTAALLFLAAPVAVRAQVLANPAADDPLPMPYPQVGAQPSSELPPGFPCGEPVQPYPQTGMLPAADLPPGYRDLGPTPQCGAIITDPPWETSPYQSEAWRIEFAIIPMLSHVSEHAFGGWENNSAPAFRLGLGYEAPDGVGLRFQFWDFDNEQKTFSGNVELSAATLYTDFYKRFYVQNAEVVLGGGFAAAGLEYDVKASHDHATLNAGGLSVFGEWFYPFCHMKQTDVGWIGRGRIALLSGEWRDHGTGMVHSTNNDMMTVIELAWGLEIRHRFGRRQDHYWYIDVVPEFQRWESSSLPSVVDPGFEGTAINFGLAW